MELTLVYITTPHIELAQQLSHGLLDKKWIACANIFPTMISIYNWNGQRERTMECVLLLKTIPDRLEQIKKFVIENHPYDTPCLIEIKGTSLNPGYSHWIEQSILGLEYPLEDPKNQ